MTLTTQLRTTLRTRATTSDLGSARGARSAPGSVRAPAMTRRRLLTGVGGAAAVVIAAPSVLAALTACGSERQLICRHQRTQEVYASWPVETGAVVTHSWVHSIERSRWSDSYRVEADGLLLVRTEFQEYGAGMPLDEGVVTLEDGRVVITEIDRPFEAIRWIHSHRVDYRIGIEEDTDLLDPLQLPDNEPVELRPA